jgi:hypothetical protein
VVLARFELPTSAGGKDCELNIFPITRVRDAMRDHLCNGDLSLVTEVAFAVSKRLALPRTRPAFVRSPYHSSGTYGRRQVGPSDPEIEPHEAL